MLSRFVCWDKATPSGRRRRPDGDADHHTALARASCCLPRCFLHPAVAGSADEKRRARRRPSSASILPSPLPLVAGRSRHFAAVPPLPLFSSEAGVPSSHTAKRCPACTTSRLASLRRVRRDPGPTKYCRRLAAMQTRSLASEPTGGSPRLCRLPPGDWTSRRSPLRLNPPVILPLYTPGAAVGVLASAVQRCWPRVPACSPRCPSSRSGSPFQGRRGAGCAVSPARPGGCLAPRWSRRGGTAGRHEPTSHPVTPRPLRQEPEWTCRPAGG